MAATHMVSIRCDSCLCLTAGGADDMRDTAAEARRVARARGWKRAPARPEHCVRHGSKTADLCPDCYDERREL